MPSRKRSREGEKARAWRVLALFIPIKS
jgi:hypothetical protein